MNAAEHRDAAMQLLADVNDTLCDHHEALILAQCAIAQALLGLLEVQLGKSGDGSDCRCIDASRHNSSGTLTWTCPVHGRCGDGGVVPC